jgi:hypothetical protein
MNCPWFDRPIRERYSTPRHKNKFPYRNPQAWKSSALLPSLWKYIFKILAVAPWARAQLVKICSAVQFAGVFSAKKYFVSTWIKTQFTSFADSSSACARKSEENLIYILLFGVVDDSVTVVGAPLVSTEPALEFALIKLLCQRITKGSKQSERRLRPVIELFGSGAEWNIPICPKCRRLIAVRNEHVRSETRGARLLQK